MKTPTKGLKNFLVDSGLVSKADINLGEIESEKKDIHLGDALVNAGKISSDDLRKAESHLVGVPFVDLKDKKIDFAVLSIIPEPVARKHNLISYKKSDGNLEVAMLDPNDLPAIEFIKKSAGLKILARLTDEESIKHSLIQYRQDLKEEFSDLIKNDSMRVKEISTSGDAEVEGGDLIKLAKDLPIVRIVDTLLAHAIVQKASDIHMEPYEKELIIRYRIDGILHDAMTLPKNIAPGIAARIKVLSNLKLDEKRLPQDGRFKIETPEQSVAFRVSTLPTYYGEKIVLRLLPDAVQGYTLETLGFHGQALEFFHGAMRQTTGMILTTGPTGSGKTTTLYTALSILNTPEVNVSTIEDPVEYQIPRISQTQVKPDIGLTFSTGLRTLVRQDPDIVMVGEIRDGETANLAINAALTGHLVLSTLHTNSAAGSIPRLLEMGAEAFLLVSTLKVVIAQRLVRKLCKIKEEYTLNDEEISKLAKNANMDLVLKALKEEKIVEDTALWNTIKFYRPKESDECSDGYSGRLGIYEVLPMSRAIHELIMKSETAEKIQDQARKEGMLTMNEDGLFKAAQGLTSIEEVLRVIAE